MSELLLGLTVAYIFLVVLLLLVLIYSHLHLLLKTGLLFLAVCFYVVSYEGWKQVQGWPAKVDLPEKFLLHFAVIEEPDEELDSKGQIFIWSTDLYGEQPADTPRAYKMPYERGLHSKLDEAMRQQRSGNIQIGTLKPQHKNMDRVENAKNLGHKYESLDFVKLPDPALPEK